MQIPNSQKTQLSSVSVTVVHALCQFYIINTNSIEMNYLGQYFFFFWHKHLCSAKIQTEKDQQFQSIHVSFVNLTS